MLQGSSFIQRARLHLRVTRRAHQNKRKRAPWPVERRFGSPTKLGAITHASVAAGLSNISTLIPIARAKWRIARRAHQNKRKRAPWPVERRFGSPTKLGAITHASVAAGLFILALTLTGCVVEDSTSAFTWSPQSAALRSLQTRRFAADTEATILQASAGVLQDLGYTIDSSESQLGLVVGSKKASAVDAGQRVTKFAMAVLFNVDTGPTDRDQKIRLSITLRRAYRSGRGYVVRAMFQRVVWNTKGRVSRRELITSPQIYQQFFSKLSKSLFLEAHKI